MMGRVVDGQRDGRSCRRRCGRVRAVCVCTLVCVRYATDELRRNYDGRVLII